MAKRKTAEDTTPPDNGQDELNEFLGEGGNEPEPAAPERVKPATDTGAMLDPRAGTYVPGASAPVTRTPREVPTSKVKRTREERTAPPRTRRTRQETADIRKTQRQRPKMKADDLGKEITEAIVGWIESRQVRPDFPAVQGAFIVATKLLRRRWKSDVLGG